MNDKIFWELSRLSPAETKEFFILYIGLDCFVKGESIEKLNKKSLDEELSGERLVYHNLNNQPCTYRLKITSQDGGIKYLLFSNKTTRRNQPTYVLFSKESKETDETYRFVGIHFYESGLSDEIVELLIDVSHNDVKREEELKKIIELILLKNKDKRPYRFVLGAGVDHGCGIPEWDELEKSFVDAVDKRLGTDGTCAKITKTMFNNTYGSFQVLKDIGEPDYEKILQDMVDRGVVPQRHIHTTLGAVASVLAAQRRFMEHQSVLTFNYDDLLERTLEEHFGLLPLVKYDDNDDPSEDDEINIIHSHGFLPKRKSPDQKNDFSSIVLTTDEYFKNYSGNGSYGYPKLFNHLDETCCFIGNSLTDYEEQKVIRDHFVKHPAQFHYCYCSKKGNPIQVVMYKTIFLMKIGVIPLWFDDHSKYVEELYEYARTIIINY